MSEHNRRLLPWVAYPGVMVTAFVLPVRVNNFETLASCI